MKKEIGIIINMSAEQASPEEIEERKSKFYNLLKRWLLKLTQDGMVLKYILKGVELAKDAYSLYLRQALKEN